METPKVSVIVSTYNRAEKLKRALDSIAKQTFQDWEVVIVDDASTDNTSEVVNEFITNVGEGKVVYHRLKKNFGQHTRPKNIGLEKASSDWIAYLDDDNAYRRDHLQVLWKEHERNPEVDCIYGIRMIIDENHEHPDSVGITSEYSLGLLLSRNYIDTSDVLHRKSAVVNIGGWDETLKKFADWNLWVRLGKNGGKFRQVPVIITDYYVHKGMNQLKSSNPIDPATGREGAGFNAPSCPIYAEKTKFGKEQPLKVAIFTLTYDRLDYTKETFASMAELAGYSFDHYVVDNGSTDGTVEWLKNEYKPHWLKLNEKNVGISLGSNQALDAIGKDYDIILKVDNDCLFMSEGWLRKIVEIYRRTKMVVCAPYVEGLIDNPGGVPRRHPMDGKLSPFGYVGEELIGFAPHLGGICIAAPKEIYEGYRWEVKDFLHGKQDLFFSQHCYRSGYVMFYLENVKVEHMDGTLGQAKKYPEYFERRKNEKITQYDGELAS